jgi:hypothetical protein
MNVLFSVATTDVFQQPVRDLARDPRESVPPPGLLIYPADDWQTAIEDRRTSEDLEHLASISTWVEANPFGDNERLVAPNDASIVPRVMFFDFVRVIRRDLSDFSSDPSFRLQLHYLAVDLSPRWDEGEVMNVLAALDQRVVYNPHSPWKRFGPQGCPNACHDYPTIGCDDSPTCGGTCVPDKITDGIRDFLICICERS